MSFSLSKDEFARMDKATHTQIHKDLTVSKEETSPRRHRASFSYRAAVPSLEAFHIDEEIHFPFYYFLHSSVLCPTAPSARDPRAEIGRMIPRSPKVSFRMELRQEQKEVRAETIEVLREQRGCALMAVYPGGGKCLAKDTAVLLASGESKPVQDIRIGDELHSTEHRKVKVKELAYGRERMYRVFNVSKCQDYTVNESHILTVFDIVLEKVVDVPLLGVYEQTRRYHGVMDPSGFKGSSSCGPLRAKIKSRLTSSTSPQKWMYEFRGVDAKDFLRACFSLGIFFFQLGQGGSVEYCESSSFHFPLTVEKLEEDGEYFGFTLCANDCDDRFLLSCGSVTHNTATSLSLCATIRLPVMILVHRVFLLDQWKETIERCFQVNKEVSVTVLQSSSKGAAPEALLPSDKELLPFFLMNAGNVTKWPRSFYEKMNIGVLIVDECHLMMTTVFSKSMFFFKPRYLLGLSATPYRSDGYDRLLSLFFGKRFVVRKLYREHDVWQIHSGLVIEKDAKDWNGVLEEQCTSRARNEMIVRIIVDCLEDQGRRILVLCKRVDQIRALQEALLLRCNARWDVQTFCGSETWGAEDRSTVDVLIATYQKVGVGFSHERLDCLVLATDCEEYFIQYLGRVFRRPDSTPLIVDVIDKHPVLARHAASRRKVFLECGGRITVHKKYHISIR